MPLNERVVVEDKWEIARCALSLNEEVFLLLQMYVWL